MQNNQQLETTTEKYSVLFFLEGLMVLSFVIIVASFTVPSSAYAMNAIIGGIVTAGTCAAGILAFANGKIGVERGLFEQPLVSQRKY
ncbi:hypothetical protein L3V77_18860 [Vibrio sp. DW001]|uniref:hypothetical protein n=1 Tax=Vibrio sp. DW001 TaxID=2912315 RepID=UPI0023B1E2A8|nr:hypothetical protein [Vibrio sp. DW001]WED29485.1 hypothetical protein L3V77_18860 [Vibrio sp. DW001]